MPPNSRRPVSLLHERWLETLDRHRDRIAIIDGQDRWTFADLADRLDASPPALFPVIARGGVPEVAVAVLRAWRDNQPVLPVEKDAPDPDLPLLIPDGTAHLKLTPGIAGKPRAVFFTAAQIAADADRLCMAMDLDPAVPNLAAISVTHSYGFSNIILPLLLRGVPVHAVEVPFPRVVADAFAIHDRLTVSAVPSIWKAWHRSGILAHARISLAISAGAPLSLELEHAVHESFALKLHNFYGASECGGISFDSSNSPRSSAADLGTPLDGVSVSIHESGRFLVTSGSVASGYAQSREGELLGGGRFLTQDFGSLQDDRLMLASSGAESINVAGRKIGPAKIEAALMATGLVARARVFGVPSHDPERVEEITAMVELISGSLDGVRHAAIDALAGWECPRHWITDATEEAWRLGRAELKKRYAS
ncbi:acyl--CoA ligase [Luteolibacter sp. GHJ8]|uniref:Acyl--CoA ligase n=1 Tax=Luteolibacter rhizosphaerae TaxID=2989719 RepID=A0ABT3G4C0_9BACT|nr:class I adenylate-forming enzyme family protein [Luteolibacter rhizosphaerae]MCW1914689.1 acyl--CoA ligase [Luteolibacter rhizosphaerae]